MVDERIAYDDIVELIVDSDDRETPWAPSQDAKILLALRELRQRREDERVAAALESASVHLPKTLGASATSFSQDLARLAQIRRAHDSARPTSANPAWLNSHHDEGFLLSFIDKLWVEYSRTLEERDSLTELAMARGARQ